MLWDIFCDIIDNHGDLGVTWRLAQSLAQRGESVRLWLPWAGWRPPASEVGSTPQCKSWLGTMSRPWWPWALPCPRS